MSVTQIAANLQISPASVSRAINGQRGVSQATRERVLAEAARLRFVPHDAARSLATTRTENIGFVLYHLPDSLSADPFYNRVMLGVEQELRQRAYHLLVTMLDDEQVTRPEDWSIVQSRRVDGLILAGPFIPPRFILSLYTQGIPMVLVDNAIAGAAVDEVLADDRQGAHRAAEHIVGHGHQAVAIVAGPTAWFTTRERCAGFEDALHAVGLEPRIVLHAEETTYETGYALGQDVLKFEPTAILAVNDAMAMGVIDAARANGLRVPHDLAVTGFDDIEAARRWPVPLTTVRLRKRYLGRIAVRHLLDRIREPTAPAQRTLIGAELLVRHSCGCGATE